MVYMKVEEQNSNSRIENEGTEVEDIWMIFGIQGK